MTVHTPIYLDYSATTPVDPRVAEKMIPYITEHFGIQPPAATLSAGLQNKLLKKHVMKLQSW